MAEDLEKYYQDLYGARWQDLKKSFQKETNTVEYFVKVAEDLYVNGVINDYEKELIQDVSKKVKYKDDIEDIDDKYDKILSYYVLLLFYIGVILASNHIPSI